MILKRFIRPKWQHPNPEVRKQAVSALSEGDAPVLAEVARSDDAPAIRGIAVRRITDLTVLEEVVRTDSDRGVREIAVKRHRELLAGVAGGGPVLEARLKLLALAEDDALLEYLALEAKEVELRTAALDRVQRTSVLRKVAISDPAPAIRLAAVERIGDRSTLESVLRSSRTRDKNVSRRAREKLDALTAERERPILVQARCEQICVSVEHLGNSGEWEQDHARLQHLERQWKELVEEASESHRSRFAKARERFLADFERDQAYAPIRAAKQALMERLEAVLGDLQPVQPPGGGAPRAAKARLMEIETAWEQLAPVPEDEERGLQASFDEVRDAIKVTLDGLRHESRCARVCKDAERLLADSRPITEQQVKAFERRWRSEGGLDDGDQPSSLEPRFEAARQGLRERLRQQLEQRKEELASLPGQLDALQAVLSAGQSKRARSLHDRIQAALKNLTDMGTSPEKLAPVLERASAVAPQLREMRDWAEWGSDGVRERLCEEMEALVGSDQDPPEIARRVRNARSEWQALAPGDPATSESLWRRFQKASKSAYKPSKRYFKDQAQIRKANLETKEGLCQKLEAFLEGADWAQMDWKSAVRLQRKVEADWHRIGPVERKIRQALEQRLRASLDPLNGHLAEERQRNRQQREDLIGRIEALKTSQDPHQAVAECRGLRKEWVTTVPGSRKEENDLWDKFCRACDDVYAGRQRMLDERDQALSANRDRKTALCVELESLLRVDPEALERAEREFRLARSTWKEIGPVPKPDATGLENRFAAVQRDFESHRQTLLKRAQHAQLELLRQRADLCAEAESVSHGSGPQEALALLETLRVRWNVLRPLDDKADEDAMGRRFEQACDGALGDGEALAARARTEAASREQREALCLRMEILAGIDSPPAFAAARMAYQVNRLSDALGGGKERPRDQWQDLVRAWGLAGPPPSETAEALEARFQRASSPFVSGSSEESE